MINKLISLGALLSGLAVIFGAFGAHALKEVLEPKYLEVFEVAVRYQMYHGFGLILVGIIGKNFPSIKICLIGGLMLAGVLIFSGSLYVVALTDLKWFGAITPIGGLCMISAWGILAWRTWRFRSA